MDMPEYRRYELEIMTNGVQRLIMNTSKLRQGPATRGAAIDFALAEARSLGWTAPEVVRVAQTPSGGWSLTVARR